MKRLMYVMSLSMMWACVAQMQLSQYDACIHNAQARMQSEPLAEISAQDLLRCITHCRDVRVVNVLGRRFYDDARIKGSVCAPLKELETEARTWNRNEKIVVYCACKQCDASAKAYLILKKMGFKRVLAYEGGIREWYRNGLPCEGPCKYEYLMRDDDNRGEEKRP